MHHAIANSMASKFRNILLSSPYPFPKPYPIGTSISFNANPPLFPYLPTTTPCQRLCYHRNGFQARTYDKLWLIEIEHNTSDECLIFYVQFDIWKQKKIILKVLAKMAQY